MLPARPDSVALLHTEDAQVDAHDGMSTGTRTTSLSVFKEQSVRFGIAHLGATRGCITGPKARIQSATPKRKARIEHEHSLMSSIGDNDGCDHQNHEEGWARKVTEVG